MSPAWLTNFGRCGFRVEEQKPLPVVYKNVRLDCGYRMDLVVEGCVIVEIKAIDQLAPIHDAQYLIERRQFGREARPLHAPA